MEKCSFEREIKTETSPINDTESEILTVDNRCTIKNEVLDDKIKTVMYDEKLLYDQLKKEIDNSLKAELSDSDNKDIGAHCSVKQEYDCDFNEEVDIKNDPDFEGIISSENCSLTFSDNKDSFHLEERMQNRTYNSENEKYCEEISDGTNKLKRENVEVHLKIRHKCDDCEFSTVHFKRLCSHREKKHQKEIVTNFKCTSCDFITKSRQYLYRHVKRVHLGQTYKCNDCDLSLASKGSLWAHKKNKHQKGRVTDFKCDFCDLITKYKGVLKFHIKNVHMGMKYECEECDLSFTSVSGLWSHRKFKHLNGTADGEFKCDSCDYTTKYKSHLNVHINGVHVKKRYKCNDCDASLGSKSSLSAHRKNKHQNGSVTDFKCNFCDLITRYKSVLKFHVKNVHMGMKHECEECDLSFASVSGLWSHRKLKHLNADAEFKCDSCDYTTKFKPYLKVHINGVHIKKRYECDDCDFSTTWVSNLRLHRKVKHQIEK